MSDNLTNDITLDEAIVIRDSGYLTPLEARLSTALVKAMRKYDDFYEAISGEKATARLEKAMRELCPSEYSSTAVNENK